MSTGFRIKSDDGNWIDIEDAVEKRMTQSPIVDFVNYTSNGESLVDKYEQTMDSPFLPFKYQGKQITAGRRGSMPESAEDGSEFASKSAGTYTISWSESEIKIGSTSYGSSSFRTGYVPGTIGIAFCGSGGSGANASDADRDYGGGGGAGGGMISLVLNVRQITKLIGPNAITLVLGAKVGPNGISKKDPPRGNRGNDSYITINGTGTDGVVYNYTATAQGGGRGERQACSTPGSVSFDKWNLIDSYGNTLLSIRNYQDGGRGGFYPDASYSYEWSSCIGRGSGKSLGGRGGTSNQGSPKRCKSGGGGGSLYGNGGDGGHYGDGKSGRWGKSATGYGGGGGGAMQGGSGEQGGSGAPGGAFFYY